MRQPCNASALTSSSRLFVYLRNCSTFASTSVKMYARKLRRAYPLSRRARRGGRVVDRGGLENR